MPPAATQPPAGPPRTVGALVQALRVLRHLASTGTPMGVSAIARATGLNGSTCFNILRTLAAEGLVRFDPQEKTYRPGIGLLELAIGMLGMNPAELIRPELERLALTHGGLICLWHLTDTERMVLIETAYSPASVRAHMPQGMRLPVLIGAVGRAVAGRRDMPEAELRRRFAELRWQSPPRFEDYLASVRLAGQRGYGIDLGQLYIGIDVIGAVACDPAGRPRYGLSCVLLAGQSDAPRQDTIGRDLSDVCQRIGSALFSGGLIGDSD